MPHAILGTRAIGWLALVIQCDTQHAVETTLSFYCCKVLQLGVHVPAGFAERLSGSQC